MIFNQTNCAKLRDLFCNAVNKVFGDPEAFLDFLANGEYPYIGKSFKYDCFLDYNGENYIINRETGEYINWYKFSHIGRDINISISKYKKFFKNPVLFKYKNIPRWIEDFLVEFKEDDEYAITMAESEVEK